MCTPIVSRANAVCPDEQTIHSNALAFREFLAIVKLFIGLQSYLPGQESPGTKRKVMWTQVASDLHPNS